MSDNFNLNEGIQKAKSASRDYFPKLNKRFVIPALITLAIPLTVVLALTQTNIIKFAGGGPDIASVAIHPGSIESAIGGKSQPMSALAYDSFGNPIYSGVTYEWSMSSTNSVGSLSRTLGNLSDFIPKNTGCGQLIVIARGANDVTKSTTVRVSSGNIVPDCSQLPTPTPTSSLYNRVFVTSTSYDGNLGGLSGADSKCQQSADAAQLGGTWKAWISDTNISAESRLERSNYPYQLINGSKIAENWTDLTDGKINYPIDRTELNTQVSGSYSQAWTNTHSDGTINNDNNDPTDKTVYNCNDWTTNSSSRQYGWIGSITNAAYWSDSNMVQLCGAKIRLYCFEQTSNDGPTPTFTPTPSPRPPTPTPTFTPTPTKVPTPTPTPIPVKKVTITAFQDAFVRSDRPATNFGSATRLRSDGTPKIISYLKFDTTPIVGKKIISAKLRLRVSNDAGSGSSDTFNLRQVSSTSWNAGQVTYNNRPALGTILRRFTGKGEGQTIDLDVRSFLGTSNRASFAIATENTNELMLHSIEAASTRPQLIIEYQ